jgi:hypothetical protein
MKIFELLQQYQNFTAPQKLAFLLSERNKVTTKLLASGSLNFKHYLHRADIHHCLGYADLAAGDAYRALTLLETYFDPDFSDFHPELENEENEVVPWPDDEQAAFDAMRDMAECLRCLVLALSDLGSLRDACNYLLKLEELDKERSFLAEAEHQKLHDLIFENQYPKIVNAENNGDVSKEEIERARLRNLGFAKREIYWWNNHEPDRSSPQTLHALNVLLKSVAPSLQVRSVELPVLSHSGKTENFLSEAVTSPATAQSSHLDRSSTSVQLGLFAKVDVQASLPILNEASALTAVRPLDASLCHNCGASLAEPVPTSFTADGPVCCPCCADAAVFCSATCLNIAQTKYHNTTCGNEDVDPVGRDENSDHPSEDLHFLLVARVFAMSHAQNTHPLDLPETKYLWGEFAEGSYPEDRTPRALPFTFQHNIVLPFRLLSILSEDHPQMSPFSPRGLDWYDTWVVQTLYAKFRGVASARQSSWDGKPEVAAVHPLWCLANHSCSPNVEWGWGRERIFQVREKPVLWTDREDISVNGWRGIKAGEEILSHYCDVNLSVKDRREYMLGPLGGECICERCVWEAEQCELSNK